MSFSEELLTTTEAAQLTGRSVDAVRAAIYANLLPRFTRNEFGRPLVRRQDLLEWASRRPPTTRDPHDCYERTWEALAEIGPASADELATYLGLHAGNVRKHLVVLARDGRARRQQPGGDWVVTGLDQQPGAA